MDTVCQACGHERCLGSSAPEWQCPSCGKAYAKTSHDSPSPLVVYEDEHPALPRRGVGTKFFLVVLFVMFGNFILVGTLYWVLTRFHLVEVSSKGLTIFRFIAAFPFAIGSLMILFGHIRNALKGFVIGSVGIVVQEIEATREPITFTVTLIGQLAVWTVMTYIFFKITAYV